MTGHQLKVERVKRDLKQIVLATRTGIPREKLSRFENGWETLHPEDLQRIREVLDQTPVRVENAPVNPAPAAHFAGDTDPRPLQALSPKEDER